MTSHEPIPWHCFQPTVNPAPMVRCAPRRRGERDDGKGRAQGPLEGATLGLKASFSLSFRGKTRQGTIKLELKRWKFQENVALTLADISLASLRKSGG